MFASCGTEFKITHYHYCCCCCYYCYSPLLPQREREQEREKITVKEAKTASGLSLGPDLRASWGPKE